MITASAWGCTLIKAREVYTQVIRSALAYGAATSHTPTAQEGPARGIAAKFAPFITKGLPFGESLARIRGPQFGLWKPKPSYDR